MVSIQYVKKTNHQEMIKYLNILPRDKHLLPHNFNYKYFILQAYKKYYYINVIL